LPAASPLLDAALPRHGLPALRRPGHARAAPMGPRRHSLPLADAARSLHRPVRRLVLGGVKRTPYPFTDYAVAVDVAASRSYDREIEQTFLTRRRRPEWMPGRSCSARTIACATTSNW